MSPRAPVKSKLPITAYDPITPPEVVLEIGKLIVAPALLPRLKLFVIVGDPCRLMSWNAIHCSVEPPAKLMVRCDPYVLLSKSDCELPDEPFHATALEMVIVALNCVVNGAVTLSVPIVKAPVTMFVTPASHAGKFTVP